MAPLFPGYPGNAAVSANDGPAAQAMGTNLTMRQLEARYIELILSEEDGSIDRAAKRLGISRSSLYSKVKSKEVERAGKEDTAINKTLNDLVPEPRNINQS